VILNEKAGSIGILSFMKYVIDDFIYDGKGQEGCLAE
jgi:hypothetical protein